MNEYKSFSIKTDPCTRFKDISPIKINNEFNIVSAIYSKIISNIQSDQDPSANIHELAEKLRNSSSPPFEIFSNSIFLNFLYSFFLKVPLNPNANDACIIMQILFSNASFLEQNYSTQLLQITFSNIIDPTVPYFLPFLQIFSYIFDSSHLISINSTLELQKLMYDHLDIKALQQIIYHFCCFFKPNPSAIALELQEPSFKDDLTKFLDTIINILSNYILTDVIPIQSYELLNSVIFQSLGVQFLYPHFFKLLRIFILKKPKLFSYSFFFTSNIPDYILSNFSSFKHSISLFENQKKHANCIKPIFKFLNIAFQNSQFLEFENVHRFIIYQDFIQFSIYSFNAAQAFESFVDKSPRSSSEITVSYLPILYSSYKDPNCQTLSKLYILMMIADIFIHSSLSDIRCYFHIDETSQSTFTRPHFTIFSIAKKILKFETDRSSFIALELLNSTFNKASVNPQDLDTCFNSFYKTFKPYEDPTSFYELFSFKDRFLQEKADAFVSQYFTQDS